MILPACKITAHSDCLLSLRHPADQKQAVASLVELCNQRHGGYVSVKLDRPKKPRTTGPKSQNHHLFGHLRQLAEAYGTMSTSELKELMKWDNVEWPRRQIKLGGRIVEVPISESDADTVTEARAIEWCHLRAAELGIQLREE